MTLDDFIYNQIYKGALAQKVNEGVARDHAIMGLSDYKKGKFKGGQADMLIKDMIAKAKKASKGIK